MKWLLLLIALVVLPVALFSGVVAMLALAFVLLLAVLVPLLPFVLGLLLVLLIVKLVSGSKDKESDQVVAS